MITIRLDKEYTIDIQVVKIFPKCHYRLSKISTYVSYRSSSLNLESTYIHVRPMNLGSHTISSSIVMHVRSNDIHLLSISLGPMGHKSVHASIATCNTTLHNSNHCGACYVPRNGTSSLISYSLSMHITLDTIMSYNNENNSFTQIVRRCPYPKHWTITTMQV